MVGGRKKKKKFVNGFFCNRKIFRFIHKLCFIQELPVLMTFVTKYVDVSPDDFVWFAIATLLMKVFQFTELADEKFLNATHAFRLKRSLVVVVYVSTVFLSAIERFKVFLIKRQTCVPYVNSKNMIHIGDCPRTLCGSKTSARLPRGCYQKTDQCL